MKTTFELPADLLRRLKARAAVQGRSMKDLITEAVEEKLGRSSDAQGGWRKVFGRASRAAVRDVDRRVKDFERIDREDWE